MLKMAFRNISRNRRRSFLTAMSLAVAAFVVVAAKSYIDGTVNSMLDAYARLQYGHVMIATTEYFERQIFLPVDVFIDDPQEVIEAVLRGDGRDGRPTDGRPTDRCPTVVPRIRFGGMVSRGDTTLPVFVMALNPADAEWLLDIEDDVIDGSADLSCGILIGKDLAKSLGVKAGDTLILLAKTSEGGLGGAKLPIEGIVEFGFSQYDRRFMLMNLSRAQKLLRMGNGVTEILVFLKKPKDADDFVRNLKLPQGVEARSLNELLGPIAAMLRFTDIFYALFFGFLVALAAFAIVNTMTVAVFERMREIGTLKAIGMTDNEIFELFTLEGALLGLAGGLTGSALGYGLAAILAKHGINYSSMLKNVSLPIPYVIYPKLDIGTVLFALILVLMMSVLAAAVPSWSARKLTPAEALRVEG